MYLIDFGESYLYFQIFGKKSLNQFKSGLYFQYVDDLPKIRQYQTEKKRDLFTSSRLY